VGKDKDYFQKFQIFRLISSLFSFSYFVFWFSPAMGTPGACGINSNLPEKFESMNKKAYLCA